MTSTPMTSQDALWLTMDRPNNLMVIDSVMWFRSVPDWGAVEAIVQERLVDPFPVFRSKPVKSKGTAHWEEILDFNLDDRINYVELPGAGTFEDLRRFIAKQRSVAFKKNEPMWTFNFITNLNFDDGSEGAAVMARFHHSIADGIRLTQAVMGLCDLDQSDLAHVGKSLPHGQSGVDIVTQASKGAVHDVVDLGTSTARTVGDAVVAMAEAATAVAKGELQSVAHATADETRTALGFALNALKFPERLMDVSMLVSSPDNRTANDTASIGKLLLAGESAETVWSGEPGRPKDASWAPILSLADVKAVGRATGTTVNDVLLSAVAGALRRYLLEHGDDTTTELIWMVPVSVLPIEPGVPTELGNHFALVMLRMPIGIDNIPDRLAQMHARMNRIKLSDEALITFGVQRGIAAAPKRLGFEVTNYFANKAVGVLTNVPGPTAPMTLAGTEVEGILGWAPCSGNQPLTICIFSYNGKVTIGFGADKKLVPDVTRLGELVNDEFDAIVHATVGS